MLQLDYGSRFIGTWNSEAEPKCDGVVHNITRQHVFQSNFLFAYNTIMIRPGVSWRRRPSTERARRTPTNAGSFLTAKARCRSIRATVKTETFRVPRPLARTDTRSPHGSALLSRCHADIEEDLVLRRAQNVLGSKYVGFLGARRNGIQSRLTENA